MFYRALSMHSRAARKSPKSVRACKIKIKISVVMVGNFQNFLGKNLMKEFLCVVKRTPQ